MPRKELPLKTSKSDTIRTLADAQRKIKEQIEVLNDVVKAFTQDKENALKDRWEVFLKSDGGKHHDWIYHFKSLEGGKFKCWCRNPIYDYLFLDSYDRGTEILICDLDERIEELIGQMFPIQAKRDGLEVLKVFAKEDYDAWREEVLEAQIKSFDYDW